jgi:hypothetical protein
MRDGRRFGYQLICQNSKNMVVFDIKTYLCNHFIRTINMFEHIIAFYLSQYNMTRHDFFM